MIKETQNKVRGIHEFPQQKGFNLLQIDAYKFLPLGQK